MKLTKQLTSLIGFTVAGFMFLSCSDSEKANYQIIPIPQEIKLAEQGEFLLNEGTKVLYPEGNAKMQNNANFLAEYVKEKTGIELDVTTGTEGKGIILQVKENKNAPESYTLKVSADKVVICGG